MATDILNNKKIRVGVLRGGPSLEYVTSLNTGAHVLKHMPERFTPIDIFISKDGDWHIGGRTNSPEKILNQVDVVWNALHGQYGEDGKAQTILESFGVPFTGSGRLSSAISINKDLTKKLFSAHGYKSPFQRVLFPKDNTYEKIIELFQTFPQPSVVKPIRGSGGTGVTIAKDYQTFKKGIEKAFRYDGAVLLEEYVEGREAVCAILESAMNKSAYSLYPVEKMDQYILTNSFSDVENNVMQNIALTLHDAMGLRHYSTVDFIVTPQRGIYLLEVNTLPPITPNSEFSNSLQSANITTEEFIDHVLVSALS